MSEQFDAKTRLFVRVMRIAARLMGVPVKRFDELTARLDSMTEDEMRAETKRLRKEAAELLAKEGD